MAIKTKNPNGAILYQGPSMLDGAPIVAIVTGLTTPSKNAKTGAMLQTWILRDDVAPQTAVKTGDDESICGQCPHRPENTGSCYVVMKAPVAIWNAYQRGSYARAESVAAVRRVGSGRKVRIGSYGDPAAVPVAIWETLIAEARTWTGYTHQWRRRSARTLQSLCMASVDNPAERAEAQAAGWRTFRVRTADESLAPGEIVCPASADGGRKTTCANCSLCKGAASTSRRSVAIIAHGATASRFQAAS